MAFLQVDFFSGRAGDGHADACASSAKNIETNRSFRNPEGWELPDALSIARHERRSYHLDAAHLHRAVRKRTRNRRCDAQHTPWMVHRHEKHGLPYWTYLSKRAAADLPVFLSRHVGPAGRNVCRRVFSMGGYGALKLALGVPETFGAAASLSGATDITRVFSAEMLAGSPHAGLWFSKRFWHFTGSQRQRK